MTPSPGSQSTEVLYRPPVSGYSTVPTSIGASTARAASSIAVAAWLSVCGSMSVPFSGHSTNDGGCAAARAVSMAGQGPPYGVADADRFSSDNRTTTYASSATAKNASSIHAMPCSVSITVR